MKESILKEKWNKFIHTLESCYLCMKYPFLYPRSRFNGRHWENQKIKQYLYGSCIFIYNENISPWAEDITTPGLYQKAYTEEYVSNDQYSYILHSRVKSVPYAIWFNIVKFAYNWILPILHCIPTYTELDSMEPGWRKRFGKQMMDELKAQLKKERFLYKFRITMIGEDTCGGLKFNIEYGSPVIYGIIEKYESISHDVCVKCGKDATLLSDGWIYPYCDECFPKNAGILYYKHDGEWYLSRECNE